jgi:hypothetical protein
MDVCCAAWQSSVLRPFYIVEIPHYENFLPKGAVKHFPRLPIAEVQAPYLYFTTSQDRFRKEHWECSDATLHKDCFWTGSWVHELKLDVLQSVVFIILPDIQTAHHWSMRDYSSWLLSTVNMGFVLIYDRYTVLFSSMSNNLQIEVALPLPLPPSTFHFSNFLG